MNRDNGSPAGSAFRKLSLRQAKFVAGLLEGKSQGTAYRDAYNTKMTGKPLRVNAARALRRTNVGRAVEEGREVIGRQVILRASRRGTNLVDLILDCLSDIGFNADHRTSDRLRACIELAKMVGLLPGEAVGSCQDDPLRRLEEILGENGHDRV